MSYVEESYPVGNVLFQQLVHRLSESLNRVLSWLTNYADPIHYEMLTRYALVCINVLEDSTAQ